MAFTGGEATAVTVLGKGSSLSSAYIYAIARGLARLPSIPQPLRGFPAPKNSRASIAVLLNKLVLSDSAVRHPLLSLIEKALDLSSGHESLDFGSPLGLVTSLCVLTGKRSDDLDGINRDEIDIIVRSDVPSVGILCILDLCVSSLTKLSDAIAALSCEEVRVDTAIFNLSPSERGFSVKNATDVASDMRDLLFGSKLVG
ncbi:hypothetical protein KSP40_PGU007231 [Platanthera guangdongensis]|uniref:Uncharacterized protein n=1 Tax=Platanthera guangdongensis TaxID=2320717 RepID=A0ABR2MRA8_9ASPA